MAQNPFYRFLPIVLNLIALILCCLVIFSGFNEGLTQLYWVKVRRLMIITSQNSLY